MILQLHLPDELKFIADGRKTQKRTTARIDGRNFIITGATSGVGLAAAKRIAKGGADLILVCRNPEKGSKVKDEIEKEHGVKVDIVTADFSDLDQVRRAATVILEKNVRIDFLVNNAGIHNTSRQLTNTGIEMVFHVVHL